MIVKYRRWCVLVVVVGWSTMAACSLCSGASANAEISGWGYFDEREAAPDSLTTQDTQGQGGRTLQVKGGTAAPTRSFDEGKIFLTQMNGATAVFSGRPAGQQPAGGRSTKWGCTYKVWGTFGGGTGGQGSGWNSSFKEQNNPRLVIEINEDGLSDDVVLLGKTGTLRVWVFGTTASISVSLSANPTGIVSGLPGSVTMTGGNTPWLQDFTGASGGDTTITASASVNGQNISDSRTVKVLGFCGKIKPADDFDGRNYQKVGVGETGTLDVDGTNLNALMSLKWSLVAGNALTIANVMDNGTASFVAGDVYGEVTLRLTAEGVTPHQFIDYNLTVVEPTSEVATVFQTLSYADGTRAAGMNLRLYLHPTDVSFRNIRVREISGASTDFGGWFVGGWTVHTANPTPARPSLPGNFTDDQVACGLGTGTIGEGHVTWNVPVQWQVTGNADWDDGKPAGILPPRVMTFETQADQTVTVRKLGKWLSRKLTDGTINHN